MLDTADILSAASSQMANQESHRQSDAKKTSNTFLKFVKEAVGGRKDRPHFRPSPRDLIRSLSTDYGSSSHNATQPTVCAPHVAASSSSSSNSKSLCESYSSMPHVPLGTSLATKLDTLSIHTELSTLSMETNTLPWNDTNPIDSITQLKPTQGDRGAPHPYMAEGPVALDKLDSRSTAVRIILCFQASVSSSHYNLSEQLEQR